MDDDDIFTVVVVHAQWWRHWRDSDSRLSDACSRTRIEIVESTVARLSSQEFAKIGKAAAEQCKKVCPRALRCSCHFGSKTTLTS